ncbi:hypothetical protein F4556_005838 [Kitasatospora gansuensis]|uniref:Uncharacterized protein n=1 Tax=Kitasatospora gansuensis TaxID=258050 RepID=A0A7W7SI49_9ACTN|nr:hypothetical protein [Kitasatospora gansuensis]MBB4950303.1 hypothetical protein [Kitasatospora gansuensis]
MNLLALVGALAALLIAVIGLAVAHRLRPALPKGEPEPEPHAVLLTIGSGLLSGFVLLTGFLVATGWAARSTNIVPPLGLYAADICAAIAVLLYPALAGLPFTARHVTAVAFFGALVGYTLTAAIQLRP